MLSISARVLWENILVFQLQTITAWKLLNIVSDSNRHLQTDQMRGAAEIRGNVKLSEKRKHVGAFSAVFKCLFVYLFLNYLKHL